MSPRGETGEAGRDTAERLRIRLAAALFAIVIATFSRAVFLPFISCDDPYYVVDNARVSGGLLARNERVAAAILIGAAARVGLSTTTAARPR